MKVALIALAILLYPSIIFADYYMDKDRPSDDIIEKTIKDNEKNFKVDLGFQKDIKSTVEVTENIGYFDLGNKSSYQVYYCYRIDNEEGAKRVDRPQGCDNDVTIIRLHNNKWIMKFDGGGWAMIMK